MPGRLVMNGVQREFMFHKPAGWRYWLKRRWDNPAGPQGLPLLVAYPEGYVTDRLGGRRPEDPEHFQLRWPFANLWEPESPFVPRPDDLPGATHHLDDQFFILVPFPYGWFDLPKTDRNDAVVSTQNYPTRRAGAWNPGGPTPFTPNEDPQDDVAFVNLVMRLMDQELSIQAGRPEVSVFDPDRRFLFGRGDGGMMALRQIHEDPPDTWAAAWIQSGAIGGRQDMRGVWPVVRNSPDPLGVATRGTSLVAHHGVADLDVPAAGDVGDIVLSEGRVLELVEAGMLEYDARNFASGYTSLATMIHDFRSLNRLLGAAAEGEKVLGVGGTIIQQTRWGAPPLSVIRYLDPGMDHWNFYNEVRPSVTPADIWAFFKAHPRTRL